MRQRHRRGQGVFKGLGTFAPAFGMIGTLIGLVQMLQNLDDPSSIGPAMAVALLTTFYGAVLANVIFLPPGDQARGAQQRGGQRHGVDGRGNHGHPQRRAPDHRQGKAQLFPGPGPARAELAGDRSHGSQESGAPAASQEKVRASVRRRIAPVDGNIRGHDEPFALFLRVASVLCQHGHSDFQDPHGLDPECLRCAGQAQGGAVRRVLALPVRAQGRRTLAGEQADPRTGPADEGPGGQ